jgi:hypothetical protein
MTTDREWRCPECRRIWLADFWQIVCRDCGNEKLEFECEAEPRRPRQRNINMGDQILGGFLSPGHDRRLR